MSKFQGIKAFDFSEMIEVFVGRYNAVDPVSDHDGWMNQISYRKVLVLMLFSKIDKQICLPGSDGQYLDSYRNEVSAYDNPTGNSPIAEYR